MRGRQGRAAARRRGATVAAARRGRCDTTGTTGVAAAGAAGKRRDSAQKPAGKRASWRRRERAAFLPGEGRSLRSPRLGSTCRTLLWGLRCSQGKPGHKEEAAREAAEEAAFSVGWRAANGTANGAVKVAAKATLPRGSGQRRPRGGRRAQERKRLEQDRSGGRLAGKEGRKEEKRQWKAGRLRSSKTTGAVSAAAAATLRERHVAAVAISARREQSARASNFADRDPGRPLRMNQAEKVQPPSLHRPSLSAINACSTFLRLLWPLCSLHARQSLPVCSTALLVHAARNMSAGSKTAKTAEESECGSSCSGSDSRDGSPPLAPRALPEVSSLVALEDRFRELLKVKRHRFMKHTVFTLQRQSHTWAGRAAQLLSRRCIEGQTSSCRASSVADGAVRKNNGYPVTSLSSLILASAARLSPSLSLDECLETLVSDWPSSSHLSGIAPPSPGPVGGQLSCPHQRLSVPVVFGAVASLPKWRPPCGCSPRSPLLFPRWQCFAAVPLPLDSLRPSSLSSSGGPPSRPFEKDMSFFQCFILSLVCSIFLFNKPRIVLFS